MTNDPLWVFYLLGLLSVLIADVSQIILKKAAGRKYGSVIRSYLNFEVIFAYFLFAVSTACSVFALKRLPLSLSPLWQSLGQVFIVLLSYFILKENIGRKKALGIGIIILGIVVSAL